MEKNEKKPSSIGVILILLSIVCCIISMQLKTGDLSLLFFALFAVLLVVGIVLSIVNAVRRRRMKRQQAVEVPATPPAAPKPAPAPVPASAPVPAPAPAQAAPAAKKVVKSERIHVRGVAQYKKSIETLGTENPDYSLTKRELIEDFLDERVWQYQFFVKASLVPEPDNEYDPNAIMVQADGLCIGYVPKGSTAHVRKLMGSGRIKSMDLNIGGGKYMEVYETDDDEYELDRDEKDYTAVLELFLTEEEPDQPE